MKLEFYTEDNVTLEQAKRAVSEMMKRIRFYQKGDKQVIIENKWNNLPVYDTEGYSVVYFRLTVN